ncbi:DNA polymerase ligase N-terminal domain-containing protein [Actinoplanes sp. NPDC051494]|uniref:DNA polymerase ligase N-terminal domain-containing protein n=1 Tax=Actinoplanes sp. NPDC051494 TaxID=3363907 RepID=UPI0037BBD84F
MTDRPAFVLHDHRKPRPHFDLRLEEQGVLRSWALPKGLPTDPARNRLAVAVPDHDLAHLTYADEHKFIADIGWWEQEDRNDKRMVLVLHGRQGSYRYALINTGGKNWLAHLTKDQPSIDTSE